MKISSQILALPDGEEGQSQASYLKKLSLIWQTLSQPLLRVVYRALLPDIGQNKHILGYGNKCLQTTSRVLHC